MELLEGKVLPGLAALTEKIISAPLVSTKS